MYWDHVPGRDQYCDNGLHRGQADVSTEILDQVGTSIVTIGQKETSTETMGYKRAGRVRTAIMGQVKTSTASMG